MFSDVRKRSKKAGQPPGTLIYTGNKKNVTPTITVVAYSSDVFYEKSGASLEECLPEKNGEDIVTWININGLSNIALIEDIAHRYDLHPLTVEDILNIEQRSKVEEFDNYIFMTLKLLDWNESKHKFKVSELSIVLGDGFVLSFEDEKSDLFNDIRDRIQHSQHQSIRKNTSDYLVYRLVDSVVDNYFLVLEGLGDTIETVEDKIIADPSKENARTLYRLKRQMLQLRKVVWPIREVISHILKLDGKLITPYTHVYFRDVYDHAVQAFDTVETFREMLSNLMDVYLSSLTNRMNEVMKVLTIIATVFIPVTFLASIYGMNFHYMPELQWKWGYPAVLCIMATCICSLLYYFKRKQWW